VQPAAFEDIREKEKEKKKYKESLEYSEKN
jgi:hypothetical protein